MTEISAKRKDMVQACMFSSYFDSLILVEKLSKTMVEPLYYLVNFSSFQFQLNFLLKWLESVLKFSAFKLRLNFIPNITEISAKLKYMVQTFFWGYFASLKLVEKLSKTMG